MIRKKKRYSRPKKAYEISRIKEENALLKRYALKNKLEVWKNIAQVDYFRRRAKSLAKSSLEEQNILFNKLKALGLNTNAISDVLALKIEDLLDRKLPTVIFKKGIAKRTIGLNDNIILDFDENNKLLGVEILDASKVLNKKTLTEAKAVFSKRLSAGLSSRPVSFARFSTMSFWYSFGTSFVLLPDVHTTASNSFRYSLAGSRVFFFEKRPVG